MTSKEFFGAIGRGIGSFFRAIGRLLRAAGTAWAKWAPVLFAWLAGLAVLVGLPLLVDDFGGSILRAWTGVFVAGAIGGLILELAQGAGRIELPGLSPRDTPKKEARDPRRPLGPQLDLGFLARLISGAIAAVAILGLYDVVVNELGHAALHHSGLSFQTRLWGVLIGVSAPAVWAAARKLVAARVNALLKAKGCEAAADTNENLQQAVTDVASYNPVEHGFAATQASQAALNQAIGATRVIQKMLEDT